jgi:Mg/Co/Ni transporter MgtE
MKVTEWINQHPGQVRTIAASSTLDEAIDVLLSEQCCLRDIYVVSEQGSVIGHLSYKKVIHMFLAEHKPVHTRRQIMERVARGGVSEWMDTHFAYARQDEELDNVINRQLEQDMEDMPVIDEQGKLLGVINMRKVLQMMREMDKEEMSI